MVVNVLKHPGESVKANEPVVEIGRLNKLRADGYIPLQYVHQIKEGMRVDAQPMLQGNRGEAMALESKVFRGKITFIDPEIQAVGESAVRRLRRVREPRQRPPPGHERPHDHLHDHRRRPADRRASPRRASRADPAGPRSADDGSRIASEFPLSTACRPSAFEGP